MDLYRDCKLFPKTLDATASIVSATELPREGISGHAARWRTARGRIARPYRGMYVLRAGAVDLLDRARAALAVAEPGAVLGFHTAAALLGFGVVESADIHLIVPAGARFPQRQGIASHRCARPVEQPTSVFGIPCSPAARTAVDLARALDRYDALAALDAALFSGACTRDDLIAELAQHGGLKGLKKAQTLVPRADHRPACRQETRLRLILLDAGLTDFVPQLPVWDGDEWPRYYLDLGDPVHRVAAEYDGSSHLSRDHLRGDRTRHNVLSSQGWVLRYFTDIDIYRRPRYVVSTLVDAVGQSRSR